MNQRRTNASLIASRGFTLIELLVVVSIIALLIAILLPALSAARNAVRTLVCSTHMDNFATAAHAYASDYKGYVPTADYEYKKPYHHLFWAIGFAPYLGDDAFTESQIHDGKYVTQYVTHHDYYRCPGLEWDGVTEGLDYTVNNFDWDAYRFNKGRNVSNPYKRTNQMNLPERWPAVQIENIHGAAASEIVHLVEASQRFGIKVADMHSDSHTVFNRDGKPKGARMIKAKDQRHGGVTTLSFFDGHAEQRELIPENFPMSLYVPGHE